VLLRHITRLDHWVLAAFYAIVSVGLGYYGWHFQHIVFHPPPPPGQVFAAVFVMDPAAHVSLSTEIYPDAPWSDGLTLNVTDAPPGQSGWILVIQCPAKAPYNTSSVGLSSYSTVLSPIQSASTKVGIYQGTGSTKSVNFDCVPTPGPTSGTSQSSQSLANVAVPALQIDQAMTVDQASPALYAQQNFPGGSVKQLVQVFPDVVCPPVAPTATGSGATAAPTTTSTGPGSAAASISPSAAPSPQTSSAPTTAVPSPSQQSAAPANPSCLDPALASTNLIQYGIPSSETITETLNQVYPQGYQISMFPVGNTMGDKIIWDSAQSGLDPDFNAVNTMAENNAGRDILIAGILWGILGGTAVEVAEHVFGGLKERKGKPVHRSIEL
jgi:hypothetical protein